MVDLFLILYPASLSGAASWVCAAYEAKNKHVYHLTLPAGCPSDPAPLPAAFTVDEDVPMPPMR